jgi:beta-N-acetylhexosaminidase
VPPLAAALTEQGVRTRQLVTGDKPAEEHILQATAAAEGSGAVVVTTSRVAANPAQQTLVEALMAAGVPVVVAATREPYDLGRFPDAAGLLAAYADQPVSMQALARVLTGAVNPTGKLPVDVPGHGGPGYRFGHGLSYDTSKDDPSTGQRNP